MQCYTELLPPTAVTHAVSLPFLDPQANNLVVAKTSLLQVFSLKSIKPGTGDEVVRRTDDSGETASKSRLVLVGEYLLAGTVTSLVSVKTLNSKSGGHALIIATREARLSLVEWDPENHRISTVSIHYYEGENVINQPFGPCLADCASILTVDPSSRCAALKFGQRHLAILPFMQVGDELLVDGEDAGFDADMDETSNPTSSKKKESQMKQVDGEARDTPYKSSFVLPLTALDPSFKHPVHLAFLYEYREPTLGILSSAVESSDALLDERKDIMTYNVITLDLEQRASTGLISVTNLPSDLRKVIPLPLPVGGALLVGTNELIHVDQSGKTSAVAVNEFAKQASDFNLTDQAHLGLKLEGSEIELLNPRSGDMLIVLNDGSFAILSFKLLGRNVGGLQVARVEADEGGDLAESAASCTAILHPCTMFVGSEDGDSRLLGWSQSTQEVNRKRSHAQMVDREAENEDGDASDEEDEDDLYAETSTIAKQEASPSNMKFQATSTSYQFQLHDVLPSIGPINDICFGRSSSSQDKLELVAASGRLQASKVAFLGKDIVPEILQETSLPGIKNTWSLCAKAKKETVNYIEHPASDNLFFAYNGEVTKVYDLLAPAEEEKKVGRQTPALNLVERNGTEFEQDGETIAISTLGNGTRIVQCRRTEIITYDSELGLVQMIPMLDEATDTELKILHTSFCDPYLLVLLDDSSIQVLKTEESGDLELIEAGGSFVETKWLSACLYKGVMTGGEVTAIVLSAEAVLQMVKLPDLTPYCSMQNVSHLPPVLKPEAAQRRVGTKETLTEVLVADLGFVGLERPYLILRSATDDLILYEPFHYTANSASPKDSWVANLRFRKAPSSYVPRYDETSAEDSGGRPSPLKRMKVGDHSTVLVPGPAPGFILAEADSLPKILGLRCSKANALSTVNWKDSEAEFTMLDTEGNLRECKLPRNTHFGTGWSARKIPLGDPIQEVRQVAYHEERQLYVVATCKEVDFVLSEEDGKHQDVEDISLRSQTPQYTLHLLSARTQRLLHSFELPQSEIVTALKVMPLEISEHSREQGPRVAVGSTVHRGEDVPTKGFLTIFDVLNVVPEPDLPESGVKLHVIAREETKGPVTAVESFPNGLVGIAQGQKLMIRGLREEGSCLPVAFLDAQAYTATLRTLSNSGFWMAGDAWKGLWFGGFTEEPYKLTVLGKSRTKMEIMAAEFLPYDGQLFVLIIDAEMDLHVLQYDPENPKSLSGSRLLHKSTFHLGHFPTSMRLLPSALAPFTEQPFSNGEVNGDSDHPSSQAPSLFHVLTTSQSGSVSLITPLDEATYRRLGAVQTHLTSILEHPAGLNPRAYRAVEGEGLGARGVIDGGIVQRISELGSARRAEVLGRAGGDAWGLRSDLEIVGGGGLAYL